MRKLAYIFVVALISIMFFAGCTPTQTVLDQTNPTVVSDAWQDSNGHIYITIDNTSNLATTVFAGYAMDDEELVHWGDYSLGAPFIYFDNISEHAGSTIKLYTKLQEYQSGDGSTLYKESALSEAYSYKIKNLYDADSEWYRAKTTIMDTTDGQNILRDIPQSGLYLTDGIYDSDICNWDYYSEGGISPSFFDNIYYLNASGLSIIIKKLVINKNGEDYSYILLDPDVQYEYALVKNNDSGNIVWHTYVSLTGIIFEDANTIELRISGNEDYCESPSFMTFNVDAIVQLSN